MLSSNCSQKNKSVGEGKIYHSQLTRAQVVGVLWLLSFARHQNMKVSILLEDTLLIMLLKLMKWIFHKTMIFYVKLFGY